MIKSVKTLDNTIENQIATAMIVSTDFLNKIKPLYKPEYIKNSFAKVVCFWCMDYHNEYQEAPGKHIRDIYKIEAESNLSAEDKEIIGTLLDSLSKQFAEEQGINADYIKDNAIEYFKKRELEIRIEKTSLYLSLGDVEKAEEQFSGYKKMAVKLAGWFSPFEAEKVFGAFDDKDEGIFVLPGALGQLTGKFERGWFVAVLGSFKRGKSFMLQELAMQALFQRLKVAFISLEMKEKNIKERLYRRITGFGSKTGDDHFLYPIFDCEHNQRGTCDRDERVNHIALYTGTSEEKPTYEPGMDYKPCAICRERFSRDYKMATWFEDVEIPAFTFQETKKQVRAFERMYGSNLRAITYPRFSAGMADIKKDLFYLEQDGFIPDVVIVDYADILRPEKGNNRIQQVDDIWKELPAMAAEKHFISITASQGTRGAIYKEDAGQDDLAEWIGKLAHVDVFLALNQTKKEKREKLLRIGVLVHRHKEVDESTFAVLLQQLETGQVMLDSQMIYKGGGG